MNWDNLGIRATGKYLKIETDKPQTIRLIGEGVERMMHGFGKDASLCSGQGCSMCAEGHEAKQRFRANVFNWNVGKVQIWDFSASVGRQLQDIAKSLVADSKKMEEIDLKISASGVGMQKKFTIMPSFSSPKPLPAGLALYDLETLPF